ncbi:hypothetical protein KO495_16640 [Colwellia sp. D2M02]|uniref:hypothetical protein n=1 Tax=Colwellia sp. D2M02 TaxID=2841562 RepID=UPI001C096568|nr:hypothetical protein [Colwellia sp. D2M02]MBU2894932.1 hypothetical protein [Colwellia sp. D2M02]
MNIKTITLFITLFITSGFSTLFAKEVPIILIEMEVYNLSNSQQKTTVEKNMPQALQAAKLESKPVLMIELGEDATIEMGTQTADGLDEDMFRVQITTDIHDNNYDIDIELTNKGAERITSLVLSLNETFVISTSINNITKLVKITSTQYETLAQAEAARSGK